MLKTAFLSACLSSVVGVVIPLVANPGCVTPEVTVMGQFDSELDCGTFCDPRMEEAPTLDLVSRFIDATFPGAVGLDPPSCENLGDQTPDYECIQQVLAPQTRCAIAVSCYRRRCDYQILPCN